jgi:tetratricopeptide (TPR) repeat protein
MPDILQTAIRHHQEGRLDQAEALYRGLLRANPVHADALHLLGVISHQRGRHREAVELIERALALHPGTATYHVNLAGAYRAAGDLTQAAAHCRAALRLQPDNAEAHNNLGLALQMLGQADEAGGHFEAALERRPSWPMPYLNLGNLLRAAGRYQEATAVYRDGIRLCAEAPLLRNNLGELLLEMGQPDEALVHCQEATRLRPGEPLALTNLGNVLRALGRTDEARKLYQQAVHAGPALALPYGQMGLLLQAEGKLDEALTWLVEAARRDPDNPRFPRHAAGVLYEQDKPDEAAARLRDVIRRWPGDAEAHNSLGYLLQDQGDMAGARAAYEEAIRLKPDYADAFLNLGLLQSEMGETEQALAAFRTALRHDPNHPEALAGLGLTLRDRLSDQETAACERLLASPPTPVGGRRRAALQYGFAQVLDARGDFGRAAALAGQANHYFKETARQRNQGYDPAEHRAYVDQIIAAYSPAHFERVSGWGLETDVPVFVLGLPRSGTSLVEQILASHPRVSGAGELSFMRDAYRAIPGLVGKQAPGVECVGRLERATVQTLARRYLDGVRRLGGDASRVVDKMPANYLMLGLIATLLPKARVIHTRRDVRDVGLSCWLTHFRHIRWACDLEHIGARIREYQRLMEHWRRVLPMQMLEIDYEEIVADLEPAARRLVAWCGLEWDPACLAFHKTKRVVRTASMNQVREPLYRRAVGHWRHYQDFLGPLLRILA